MVVPVLTLEQTEKMMQENVDLRKLLRKLVNEHGHGQLCESEITPSASCDCGWRSLKKQADTLIGKDK